MKSWLPLLDRILLKQDEAPMLHPGTGIAMSEQDRIKYRPNTGKVVKVGPGRRHDDGQVYPVAIPEGANVMFSPTGGTEVEHDGVPHLMVREQDVFLLLDTPKAVRTVQAPGFDAVETTDGKTSVLRYPSGGCDLGSLINDAKKRGDKSLSFGALRPSDRESLLAEGYHVDSINAGGGAIVSWPA